MITKKITHRELSTASNVSETEFYPNWDTLPTKLKQIYAVRGIHSTKQLNYELKNLIPPSKLLNADKAAEIIFNAIKTNQSILVVGDFDADGATSSALMMKALGIMGAKNPGFLVPDRVKYGYGLSVKLVETAALRNPDLIITVDNGISNHDGVARANELNIPVIVTDHHLAGETLPDAAVIVNPNQPGDSFSSKHLAGVGVAFYVMLALRSLMREKNWFVENSIPEPNLAELLDLVALGTVADVVVLDQNNRILVEQGLKRIRSGRGCFGINALLDVARRQIGKCQASDLGFAVGPRLNAAGRLKDMSIGINCLLSDSEYDSRKIAVELDSLNKRRRGIEQEMTQQAEEDLDEYFNSQQTKDISDDLSQRPTTLCLYNPKWHQGVIGILASRIKEKINRPVIIFAKDENSEIPMIKGSARSVAGVHIRDVLALVDSLHPDLIEKFGGHSMAAGLSMMEDNFQFFAEEFHHCTDQLLAGRKIADEILTDAGLNETEMTIALARSLRNGGPWGQGFPEPLFDDEFVIISQKIVGERHLKLILKKGELLIDAIHFFFAEDLTVEPDDTVRVVYKLDINEFRGNESLQLIVEQIIRVS